MQIMQCNHISKTLGDALLLPVWQYVSLQYGKSAIKSQIITCVKNVDFFFGVGGEGFFRCERW